MSSITAVELGAGTCAFARTSVRRGEVRLSAVEILDPTAFPGMDAFTVAIQQTRRALKLPRRCRALIWGLPDGANRKDPAVKPLLAPLTGAGFRVEAVVSPCNALAALARRKTSRGEGSVCWLAINRGGVAIVVVRPGKLLYAHSFPWDPSIGASGSQARLLQRYWLVSYLSPEVKRALAEARKAGTPVDAIVTCGNLPDLRSLTMPLIEELDVEVETLDSLDGLVVKPQVVEKLGDSVAAIRLACAAAIARGTRPWDPSKKGARSRKAGAYLRAAVLAAAVVGLGYAWYAKTRPSAPVASATPSPSRIQARGSVPGKPPNDPRTSVLDPRVPAKKPETAPPAVSVPPASSRIAARGSMPGKPPNDSRTSVLDPRVPAKKPETNPPPAAATNSVPRNRVQPLVTAPSPNVPPPTAPRPTGALPPANVPAPAVSARAAYPKGTPPAMKAPLPPLLADKPATSPATPASSPAGPGSARGPMPPLLKDAVPKVTAILVARDRRFATIAGGQIIGIGDVLGRRTVVGMDERSVVLQEPSGAQIRIGLGGRLLGVERANR